jgi:hypothetical protein
MACIHHPALAVTVIIDGWGYCARCVQGMQIAAAKVDAHVTPSDCFVWYKNAAEGWQPIAGTGCAHYVAHQLNIRCGGPSERCLKGFTYRVPILTTGKTKITAGATAVQVGDIWVQTDSRHTGLVSRIDPAPQSQAASAPASAPAAPPIIWITHASSAQHKLATNRFDVYFHGRGDFFR